MLFRDELEESGMDKQEMDAAVAEHRAQLLAEAERELAAKAAAAAAEDGKGEPGSSHKSRHAPLPVSSNNYIVKLRCLVTSTAPNCWVRPSGNWPAGEQQQQQRTARGTPAAAARAGTLLSALVDRSSLACNLHRA